MNATEWRLDGLTRVGEHHATMIGEPRLVDTDIGPALSFDGVDDGLLVDVNPIAGRSRFTIEVLFRPAPGGPEEQRFLHIEESAGGNRALVELRMRPDSQWALDTYLRSRDNGLTLLDRDLVHPADRWHVAALTYDGRTMKHFVDGRQELSGEVVFDPLGAGRTSIGVRQNRVSWFKGLVHTVRVTADALPPERLMQVPSGRVAAPRIVMPLWPEGVPGQKAGAGDEREVDGRTYNVHTPTLVMVPPRVPATGTAVVICAGGSYERLALANEAEGIASRLADTGITSFILKYRLKEYGHPAPLRDVLRAVRLLRSKAKQLGLAADRIGVIGASAGGHLAASAATLFDAADGRTGSPLDGVSARPDFVALLYPVITMEGPAAHPQSVTNLLGQNPSANRLEALSLERHVRPDTPPLFIVHTGEDRSVPAENSLLFYNAARKAGVPVELHLYERGPHGFGTRTDVGPASGWLDRWLEWLRARGLL